MKLNWGNILIIAFVLFGGMIILLVVKSIKSNYDMVSKEYYKEELVYQNVIDAKSRTLALGDSIKFHQSNQQMIITLPSEITQGKIVADIHLYCAYDAKKDANFQVDFEERMSSPITLTDFDEGIYTLKLKFNADGKDYYQEKEIKIKH